MRFLVDMDGVLADWGAEWDRHAIKFAHLGLPLTTSQTSFNLTIGLSEEGVAAVNSIMEHPGFYANMEPFDGAAQAMNEMVAAGHDVHIVTSPWISNISCASDKLKWAEDHIGPGWAKRTVITTAKTLVRGDILIDDRPDAAEGSKYDQEWEQVYFTQQYNKNLTGKRRIDNWSQWRTLELGPIRNSILRGELV